MELSIGQVVLATAGRDSGKLLVVVKIQENRIFLCDGKERPLERPKAKNPRHVQTTTNALDKDAMATNRNLKKALSALRTK